MTRSFRSAALLLLALVVMLTVLLWGNSRRGEASSHRGAAVSPAAGTRDTASPNDTAPNDNSAARAVAVPPGESVPVAPRITLGAYLENYWGEHWRDMKPKLEDWCLATGQTGCLEQLMDAVPPPWESVAEGLQRAVLDEDAHTTAAMRNLIAWPQEELTVAEVKNRFSVPQGVDISPSALRIIENIGQKYNAEIKARAESWQTGVEDAARSLWLSGNYERGPLFLPPFQGVDSLHTITLTQNQWCVTLTVERDQFPWLAEQVEFIDGLKSARKDEIQLYLNSLH